MNIKEVAAKYQKYLSVIRYHFHAYPEISEQEFETSKRIKEELDEMGIEWRPCGLETGVLATIRGEKPGKTILLRADIDALSVQEETGLPYASQKPGIMHACGHDCHMAMLLTAAQILKDMKGELCGTVKLAFQPAEELGIGAKAMIADGVLDGVDGCFAIHVWSEVEAGRVSVEAGPRMSSSVMFKIDITGRGAHGAAPHQGVDAIIAANAVISNLQTIVSREINPIQPAVITIGLIQAGTRWSVVAEYAHMEGTARGYTAEVVEQLRAATERVVNTTAETFRVDAKLDWKVLVPPTVNDEHISSLADAAARKVMGPEAPVLYEKTSASEDFADFQEKVPGVMAFLGIRNEACGAIWPNHSGRFCVDESVLLKGAMLYAQIALDFNAE